MRILGAVGVVLVTAGSLSAGTLNERFPFPDAVYEQFPDGRLVGQGVQGDVTFEMVYQQDPEGGHPLARSWEAWELEEPFPRLFQGVILSDPTVVGGVWQFLVAEEDPFNPFPETWVWDVPQEALNVATTVGVPNFPAGWLLLFGCGVWLGWHGMMWVLLRI